ncbi:MAG: threonine synthase [Chloroflexi bacterium]|nr:threonine synthase [Chloroflexota bacterium]
MTHFVCSGCSASYPIADPLTRCPSCGEPLEVSGPVGRPALGTSGTMLGRHREWLPFPAIDDRLSLGEGNTPIIEAGVIARQLGLRQLLLKHEGMNPTGSFKDRGTIAGVQRARWLGWQQIGTLSTGGMASSVAAYAARAGLRCFILVPRIIPERFASIAVYRPTLVEVHGHYGQMYYDSLAIGRELGIYFINSDDPFRVEGQKTVAFEIFQQLGGAAPDALVMPVSSGGNLSAVVKGFRELHAAGLIVRLPRILAVQAAGCAPIATAFQRGERQVEPFPNPATVAAGLSNPLPPSGNRVLRRLAEEGGRAVAVTDEEILLAQRRLAEAEGVWAQPESTAAIAALPRLIADGQIDPSWRVVVILTGHGLKTPTTVQTDTIDAIRTPQAELRERLAEAVARGPLGAAGAAR